MTKNQLHPGAKWLFRIQGWFSVILLMFFISWFIVPVISALSFVIFGEDGFGAVVGIVIGVAIFIILATIIISEIYARMAYNRWFYEFTGSNLRIERGVIFKRYSNIPYERVQNVDIHRGILARILGFSTVDIQTAGFHMTGRYGGRSEGHIPAVDPEYAEKIRDFLMKKISKSKKDDQGL